MAGIIRLELAVESDSEKIRDLMVATASDEAARWFKNGELPFIPGYNSIDMQRYHMWDEKYYKIMYNEELAGVILITYTGREHARIDRLYIFPEHQNKGIGAKTISLIEDMYPMVKVWTLDCIQKSIRNHYFYEKNGYRVADQDEHERYYRKVIGELDYSSEQFIVEENFSDKNFRSCSMANCDLYDINMNNSKFTNTSLNKARYQNCGLRDVRFTNVNLSNAILGDSNLSKIEICHSSLAGAYIHDTNLGYQGDKTPLVIEGCELMDSKISNCDLTNLSIENCNIQGMKINGLLVTELLKKWSQK